MTDAKDPRSLVVFGFDDQLAAQEMLTTLARLTTDGTLILQDAVFVTKNEKGRVQVVQTTDPSPGQAAWSGAFWGLLFGILLLVPIVGMAIGAGTAALLAKLIDTGIDDKFVKELRGSIEPGKVYLAVLVSHVNKDKALEEMRRYAGLAQLVTTNISPEAETALEDALGQDQVRSGVSDEESIIVP